MIELRVDASVASERIARRLGDTATRVLPSALQSAVRDSTLIAETWVRALTPVRTGTLRGSLVTTVGPLRGEVASRLDRAPYGPVVEQGSRPHTITARGAGGILAFRGRDGSVVLTRRVNHPGFRGRAMFATGFARALPQIRATFERWVATAIATVQ